LRKWFNRAVKQCENKKKLGTVAEEIIKTGKKERLCETRG
jgi:hypothetical protein